MNTLRSAPIERRYRRDLAAGRTKPLEQITPLKEFKHFTIIDNQYPHDRIAKVHHLLVPKRVVDHWTKLNWRERREFKQIDGYLSKTYDCIKLNYPSYISVKYIVHWHLYSMK